MGVVTCQICGTVMVEERFADHTCPLSEDQMRNQMYRTMQAAEDAFKAITAYLTPKDQAPAKVQRAETSPDYSSLQAACGVCSGIVVFKDYERQYHSPEDTCNCPTAVLSSLHLPEEVKAIYQSVLEHRFAALTPGTIDRIIKVQDRHRKALAVVAQFFHSTNSFSLNPRREVERLVGIKACSECGGSGWLARDEMCRTCNGKGFLS